MKESGHELKRIYQDPLVAERYDQKRFMTASGRRRNRRKMTAIQRAIREASRLRTPVSFVLDLPCGTGRIFPALSAWGIRFAGGDASLSMMLQAKRKLSGKNECLGLIQCDGEFLPFKDESFDAVLCIRFITRLPRDTQVDFLREMVRVSRRWLIIDFRHRYTLRYLLWLVYYKLSFWTRIEYRFSKDDLEDMAKEANSKIVRIFSTRPYAPFLSDKWVVLLEKVL